MIWTYSTIMRATIDRLCREYSTLISWLVVVFLALEIGDISSDEYLFFTMFKTILEHVDSIILEDNLGIDGLETLGTEGTSEFIEDVWTDGHIRIF
jgi:hypothetical protein